MKTQELVERFIAGATRGRASSLRIEGDTLYSYDYPLATRDAAGDITVNDGPCGYTIRQTGASWQQQTWNAAPTLSKRNQTYLAKDAAYSVTTSAQRNMVRRALAQLQ